MTEPVIVAQQAPEALTEAEAIGVLVTGALASRERDRETARRWAVHLEGELAQAERHLAVMTELVTKHGTTWAKDGVNLEAAIGFLNRDRDWEPSTVDQSPEPTPGA